MNLREIISDSLKYWEPRRLVYNGCLGLIVLFYALPALISGVHFDLIGGILGLFVLAAIANVLYCAAYIPDVFLQMSDFRVLWCRMRWALFIAGTTLASIFAWFLARGIFCAASPVQ